MAQATADSFESELRNWGSSCSELEDIVKLALLPSTRIEGLCDGDLVGDAALGDAALSSFDVLAGNAEVSLPSFASLEGEGEVCLPFATFGCGPPSDIALVCVGELVLIPPILARSCLTSAYIEQGP